MGVWKKRVVVRPALSSRPSSDPQRPPSSWRAERRVWLVGFLLTLPSVPAPGLCSSAPSSLPGRGHSPKPPGPRLPSLLTSSWRQQPALRGASGPLSPGVGRAGEARAVTRKTAPGGQPAAAAVAAVLREAPGARSSRPAGPSSQHRAAKGGSWTTGRASPTTPGAHARAHAPRMRRLNVQ